MKRIALITLALAALSAPALAGVTVDGPWVRTTSSKTTAAFMQITSSSDARLVKASSPVAKVVEIHQTTMNNYMMTMRAVPAVDLPAGEAVKLKPDGYLVMLMGLKQEIKEGDTIPISLVIEGKNKKLETIQVNASAMTMDAANSDKHSHAQTQEQEHDHMGAHEHTHDHSHMM